LLPYQQTQENSHIAGISKKIMEPGTIWACKQWIFPVEFTLKYGSGIERVLRLELIDS
jgi:hypothetical protein